MFAFRPKFNKSRMSGSSYFDIDSILAESEPVVTEVLMDCYNMDSLESGAIKLTSSLGRGVDLTQLDKELDMIPELKESAVQSEETRGAGLGKRNSKKHDNDLALGTKVEIPLWLAVHLATLGYVKILVPMLFSENFKKVLLASPQVVDLRTKSHYFYEVGVILAANLPKQIDGFLFLSQIFFERMKIFINLIMHLKEDDDHSFIQKLTDTEFKCFDKGREALNRFGVASNAKKLTMTQNNIMKNRKSIKQS